MANNLRSLEPKILNVYGKDICLRQIENKGYKTWEVWVNGMKQDNVRSVGLTLTASEPAKVLIEYLV